MTVVLNSAQAANRAGYTSAHPTGASLPVRTAPDGNRYVEVRRLPPSEVLVLSNYPVH